MMSYIIIPNWSYDTLKKGIKYKSKQKKKLKTKATHYLEKTWADSQKALPLSSLARCNEAQLPMDGETQDLL